MRLRKRAFLIENNPVGIDRSKHSCLCLQQFLHLVFGSRHGLPSPDFVLHDSEMLFLVVHNEIDPDYLLASTKITVIASAARDYDIGVLHVWFDISLKITLHEFIISCEDLFMVSTSFRNISEKPAAQCSVRVTLNENLQTAQVSDSL